MPKVNDKKFLKKKSGKGAPAKTGKGKPNMAMMKALMQGGK